MSDTRYCILCGEPFDTDDPEAVFCPDHGGKTPVKSGADRVEEVRPPVDSKQEVDSTKPGMMADWKPGDLILDTYEVKGVLGEGGFGAVYRAHHQGWNMDLAVKRALNLDDANKQDFIDEAQKWIDLGLHPHIISCYYVRNIDGFPHTFAELAEGGSLHDWITEEQGNLYEGNEQEILTRILDLAIQFAWGLGYAHQQGLLHGDVKPQNALMTLEGVLKVTDFGLARAGRQEGKAGDGEPAQQKIIYSPYHCSPEQRMGNTITLATDIWSWGVSVLEMFTGGVSWMGGQVAATALESYLKRAGDEDDIPPMPGTVANLLRACFQEEPLARPQDMFVIAEGLIEIYQNVIGQVYPKLFPMAVELRAASLNNKALSLMDLAQPDKAIMTWTEALAADPLHLATKFNHGLILWRTGKLTDENLLANIHSAGVTNPEKWESSYLSCLVHFERGDVASAKKELQSIEGHDLDRREVQAVVSLVNNPEISKKFILHTSFACTTRVTSVSLSTDGHYTLSGDNEKTVRLWDSTTGRCLCILEGHTNCVKSVCLSHDGRFALSGSDDHTIKLWDLEKETCLHTFKGHKDRVTSVFMSKDGRYALSGSWNKMLKLWDIASGRCLRTFEGHKWSVESVCLSRDGHLALSGSWDNTLKLWEVESGRCLRTFAGHTDTVNSVCFSSDGRTALSASNDRTLKLWDIDTGECLQTYVGHQFFINSVSLSEDGCFAVSSSFDHSIRLWDVKSGRCLRTFSGEKLGFSGVSLSTDGQFVLSGGDDALNIWKIELNVKTPVAPFVISQINPVIGALSNQSVYKHAVAQAQLALEDGDILQAAQQIRFARSQPGFERDSIALNIWRCLYVQLPRKSIIGFWKLATFDGHNDQVTSVCLSKDGRLALSGSKDKTVKLWNVPDGKCLNTFIGHDNYIWSVCLSDDGRFGLSGSLDHSLKLWELSSGRCIQTFSGHTSSVNSVVLSADGRFAVSGGRDRTVRLWEVESGRQLRVYQPNSDAVKSVCLTPDGNNILADNGYETLKIWKVANERCIRSFKGIWLECCTSLSGDGYYAITASGTLKLWEIATGNCLHTFDDPSRSSVSISFSGDGHFALAGDRSGNLKLWDVKSGRCLRVIDGHCGKVNSVYLSPGGFYALSGGEDKAVNLWALDWDLDDIEKADWDEGAQPYLETFLTLHTPYAGKLPLDLEPSEEEIRLSLTRRGKPTWAETDFQGLLTELGYRGYGWLQEEGVRVKLEEMAKERG